MPETSTVLVVFDLESDDAPMPLGRYLHTTEDVVFYVTAQSSAPRSAPADCVAVVSVKVR